MLIEIWFIIEYGNKHTENFCWLCKRNFILMFDVYYHKVNNEYFYCLNWKQLGQYWQCLIKDRDTFCPERCEKCTICKEMTNVFTELQDSFFFYPKQSLANKVDLVPYQPVLCVFNSVIDKKKKKISHWNWQINST